MGILRLSSWKNIVAEPQGFRWDQRLIEGFRAQLYSTSVRCGRWWKEC